MKTLRDVVTPDLRAAMWRGALYALLLIVPFAIFIGWRIDAWRVRHHERLKAVAVAVVDADLRECQRIVGAYQVAAGERADYAAARKLAWDIWAAQQRGAR